MLGIDSTETFQIKMALEMPDCARLVAQNILCVWCLPLSMVL